MRRGRVVRIACVICLRDDGSAGFAVLRPPSTILLSASPFSFENVLPYCTVSPLVSQTVRLLVIASLRTLPCP
jgi:hypothetical protein